MEVGVREPGAEVEGCSDSEEGVGASSSGVLALLLPALQATIREEIAGNAANTKVCPHA